MVMGEVLQDWPTDLFIPPDALEVVLESFQGPLDLLLYLIRRQNLDILDIPVADNHPAIHDLCRDDACSQSRPCG